MRAEAIKELFAAPAGRTAKIHELADIYRDEITIEAISPNPNQPRRDINPSRDDFMELVASIRLHGLLQPIVVTPDLDERDQFVLIAGERRWRAVLQLRGEGAGWERIPATVIKLKDPNTRDAELLCKALSENVVRTNLEASELACAVTKLREISGWTVEQVAERLGINFNRVIDLSAIARYEPVLEAVREGIITRHQAVVIGQGAEDASQAAELVGKSQGKDRATTARMVKALRQVGEVAPKVEELVRTPPPQVDVDRLPISRLVGGGLTPREEIYAALDRTCSVLGYWPIKPAGK